MARWCCADNIHENALQFHPECTECVCLVVFLSQYLPTLTAALKIERDHGLFLDQRVFTLGCPPIVRSGLSGPYLSSFHLQAIEVVQQLQPLLTRLLVFGDCGATEAATCGNCASTGICASTSGICATTFGICGSLAETGDYNR